MLSTNTDSLRSFEARLLILDLFVNYTGHKQHYTHMHRMFRLHYVVILFYFIFAFSGGQLDGCYDLSGNLPRM